MRLFAALDLDDATRNRLQSVMRDLGHIPGIRWTKPEALHVTLRFFGAWPGDRLPEVVTALGSIEPPPAPIKVRFEQLSFLPSEQRPRVFVAVGDTTAELARFQFRIEEVARSLGFAPERRRFLTHVTLGRLREPRQGKALVAAARVYRSDLGAFAASSWTLYSSQLTPAGAVYTSVARWPFAP